MTKTVLILTTHDLLLIYPSRLHFMDSSKNCLNLRMFFLYINLLVIWKLRILLCSLDSTTNRIPKATVQRRLQKNNRNSGALWTFKQQLVYKVRVRYVKVTIANFGIRCMFLWKNYLNRCTGRGYILKKIPKKTESPRMGDK